MCNATALFIFRRRQLAGELQRIVAHIQTLEKQAAAVHEYEFVVFLHDCFAQALGKSLKLNQEEAGVRRITRKWKDYDRYAGLIPLLIQHRINPQAFFTFAVAARQRKRIPPLISNIATPATIEHFLQWRKLNTHRAATYLTNKTYEDQLVSQLRNDAISLTSFLLRKPVIALNANDAFLFSSPGRVMLNLTQDFPLDSIELVFLEDMRFNPAFLRRTTQAWNAALRAQMARVQALDHELRDAQFRAKLQRISELLRVLCIPNDHQRKT